MVCSIEAVVITRLPEGVFFVGDVIEMEGFLLFHLVETNDPHRMIHLLRVVEGKEPFIR